MMKKELGKILRKAPAPRSRGEAAYYLLAPAAFALAQLYYIRSAHIYFYHSLPLPLWAALIPSLPLLALEYAATRLIEARRLGMTPAVRLGLYARLLFFAALCALFFFYPVFAQGGPSIFLPLIGLWHFVALTVALASPLPAALCAAGLAAAYWLLVYRRSAFRLTVTVILPGLSAAALFLLLYFFPASPLRPHAPPPPGLEKIFPGDGLLPADGRAWPGEAMFPHEVYAAPDDSWVAASFGATFGRKEAPPPTFAWIDLRGRTYRAFHEDSQVRRFSTDCPDRLYFGPWHKPYVARYVPGAAGPERLPLPDLQEGRGAEEIFAVHNACGRVYVLNNIDPWLYVLDADGGPLRSLSMSSAGLLEKGSVALQLTRNPRRGTLLISGYGRDPGAGTGPGRLAYMALGGGALPGRRIFELDEETLELRGWAEPKHPSMDLEISPDGEFVYAPAIFAPFIYRFRADGLKPEPPLDAPPHIRSLAFSGDGRRLYAASYIGGDVLIYDAASGKRLGSFFVTPRVSALAVTTEHLYMAGAGGIFRISEKDIAALLNAGQR
ncbi:MAG: WD40 repeat domain-containing protein [Elusimicrobiota bacterium]